MQHCYDLKFQEEIFQQLVASEKLKQKKTLRTYSKGRQCGGYSGGYPSPYNTRYT